MFAAGRRNGDSIKVATTFPLGSFICGQALGIVLGPETTLRKGSSVTIIGLKYVASGMDSCIGILLALR